MAVFVIAVDIAISDPRMAVITSDAIQFVGRIATGAICFASMVTATKAVTDRNTLLLRKLVHVEVLTSTHNIHVRGIIKNYVDFSHNFWLYDSTPLKLSIHMDLCNMQQCAKIHHNPSIRYKIVMKWKHPFSPSWSTPITSVTSTQNNWFWTTKSPF